MQRIQIEAEGHHCPNPECGADSDHLTVSLDENGIIWVGCYECSFMGRVA